MRESDEAPRSRTASVRDSDDPSENTNPSDRVVRTVAALTDTDPVELPALYDAVDPAALDRLVDPGTDSALQLRFTDAGTEVHINRTGVIEITALSE